MDQTRERIEEVILLDESGNAIGRMDKRAVHHQETPLHAAFSVFLFNRCGEMLCQQRALHKPTWPGVWSNACCGHPAPGESTLAAAQRRLEEELGLRGLALQLALPDFRYRATFQGIVENEICPVFIGMVEATPIPNPREVAALSWVPWAAFSSACLHPNNTPFEHFSIWSLMEGRQLAENGSVRALLAGLLP
jgi:isopentenyl-diphosphate delta-isomerase